MLQNIQKSLLIKYWAIFLLNIGLIGIVCSQSDFKPGYVVVSPGDTIFGEIEMKGDINMAKSCSFRYSSMKETKVYLPQAISSYRIKNGRYYVSREILLPKKDSSEVKEVSQVFLEFLVKGKMNLFYLRNEKGDHYFIEKENEKLVELKYEEMVREVDGQKFYTKSKNHIGLLYIYTKDVPELRSDIESIETPNSTSMVRLATKYHNLICKDQKCLVFRKAPEPVKISIEGILGVVVYNAPYIEKNNYLNGGMLLHLRFPSTENNFFLKTGLIYADVVYFEKNTSFFKIPLHFEYISKGNILKARFSVGSNLYTNQFLTLSSLGGILVKIANKVHLTYSLELESPLGFRTSILDLNYGMQGGILIGL